MRNIFNCLYILAFSLSIYSCDKGVGFVYDDNHIFDKNSDISRMTMLIGAATNTSYGQYADLVKGKAYTGNNSRTLSENIDLTFQHSSTKGANLVSTGSSKLSDFSAAYNVIQQYAVINDGVFIRIKAENINNIPAWDSITNSSQLFDALKIAEQQVVNNSGYLIDNDGPNDIISYLQLGDIVFYKSLTRSAYSIIRITQLNTGASGFIRADVKTTTKQRI